MRARSCEGLRRHRCSSRSELGKANSGEVRGDTHTHTPSHPIPTAVHDVSHRNSTRAHVASPGPFVAELPWLAPVAQPTCTLGIFRSHARHTARTRISPFLYELHSLQGACPNLDHASRAPGWPRRNETRHAAHAALSSRVGPRRAPTPTHSTGVRSEHSGRRRSRRARARAQGRPREGAEVARFHVRGPGPILRSPVLAAFRRDVLRRIPKYVDTIEDGDPRVCSRHKGCPDVLSFGCRHFNLSVSFEWRAGCKPIARWGYR